MVFFAKSEEKQSIKFNILLMANLNDSQVMTINILQSINILQ